MIRMGWRFFLVFVKNWTFIGNEWGYRYHNTCNSNYFLIMIQEKE